MTATHYFFLLIAIFILLFVIALILPKIKGKQNKPLNNANSTDNKALAQLFNVCQELLSPFDYRIVLADNYITLIKNNQKVALLTLDDKLNNHTRKMGDSVIINFKTLPNKKALEQRLIQDKIIMMN